MGVLTRRKALKVVTGAVVSGSSCVGALANALADKPTMVTAGPDISIPSALFGTSAGANLAPLLHDTSFVECLGQLAPSIFRYPGGNGANWFDISTGTYVTAPVVPRPQNTANFRQPFTFAVLQQILEEANAEPSIVLNLLTGKMDTQIEALKRARSLGIPVKRIELGNEYYLRGAKAGTDAYARVFPTAADYARTALQYAKALRKEFPECRIGVPILAREAHRDREASWNSDLLRHIDSSIDAVIAHIYRRLPATFGGDPPGLFAAAFEPPPFQVVGEALRHQSRSVWVTETNLTDPSEQTQTWGHGVALALDLMNMLALPRVEQVLCWSLLGNKQFCLVSRGQPTHAEDEVRETSGHASRPSRLTANGHACRMLFRVARGKTTASPLRFSPNSTQQSPSGVELPSLYGWKFGSDSALLVNLSPQQQRIAIHDPGLAANGYFQRAAGVMDEVSDQGSFALSHGETSQQLMLPPYSMTAIGNGNVLGA